MNKWGLDLKLNLIFMIYIKNLVYIDKCLWMKYEKLNESEYNENAWYKDKMLCFVHEKYT